MTTTEHRIFGITEMLEAILDKLPQKDLLLSKRVCKAWGKVIDKSENLQKALFFMADGVHQGQSLSAVINFVDADELRWRSSLHSKWTKDRTYRQSSLSRGLRRFG